MPVNQEELTICRRRGHSTMGVSSEHWMQCRWCGMWLRERRTFEEREDDPPENERSPFERLKKRDKETGGDGPVSGAHG